MSVRTVKAGSTDVSVTLRIIDSADGTPETGVVFNTSGIDLWYRREGAVSTDITEATLADLTAAHSDGGFLHINDGVYRLDLPDAACASGVAGVQIGGTVTGMVVLAPYLELPVNIESDTFDRIGAPAGASISADLVAIEAQTDDIGAAGAGLTAVPWNAAWDAEVESEVDDALGGGTGTALTSIPWNAAWDAEVQSEATDALNAYDPPTNTEMEARTLPYITGTADSGTTTTLVDAARTEADGYWNDAWIFFTSGTLNGVVRLVTDFVAATDTMTLSPATPVAVGTHTYIVIPAARIAGASAPTSAEVADAVWDEVRSGHTTAGTFGEVSTPADVADAVWDEAQADHVGAGTFGITASEIADVLVDTAEIGVAGAGLTNINLPNQTMDIVGNITGNLSGSVGSVTGAVGSVGTGGIAAASFAAGAIDAAAIAADAIGSSELAASAVTEIRSLASGTSDSGTTTTMVDAARTEADTDYWVGSLIVFTSGNIAGQARYITAFTPASDTITFAPATTQAVATQTYEIWPTADFLRPTTSGRTIDVSAGGEAGLDWANIGSPTTAQNLSATNIDVDQVVASVSGAVASVTGNVGGNVTGSVGSVATGGIAAASFAAGAIDATAIATDAITATKIAADAIGASELAADAVTEIQSGLATAAALDTVDNFLDTEIAAILAAVDTEVAAIKAVTDLLTAAQSEPTGVPAADETPLEKLGFLFAALRNRITVTASKKTFFDDAGSPQWEKDLSDDGTTYSETEGNVI